MRAPVVPLRLPGRRMITLVVVLGVWLALCLLVWALCVAAGRAHAKTVPGGSPGTVEPGEPSRAEAARVPAPVVVADLATLQPRLEAAAVVLRAQRVAVTVSGEDEDHEVAAGGAGMVSLRPQEIAGPIAPGAFLVASRGARDQPFGATDRELVAALAQTLGDALVVADRDRGAARGRFARTALAAAPPSRR